jgi:site-specific recombinase XerD
LVQSYFDDHLRRVRGASRHALRTYAHAVRLFFLFLADRLGRSIADLRVEDIQVDAVLAFLDHIEGARRNTSATRNCRLAAIRGLVAYLLRHDIARAAQYQRILGIPSKKATNRPVTCWEPEVVAAILAQPDRATLPGARDHTLLPSSITPALASARLSGFGDATFSSRTRTTCGFTARATRSASAHSGTPRPLLNFG